MKVRSDEPRWRRAVRLYWLALRGKSFACQAAFDGAPHRPHRYVGQFTGRTFECGGLR